MSTYRNDIQTSDKNIDEEDVYNFNPYFYCPLMNGFHAPFINEEENLMRQRRPYRPRPIRRIRRPFYPYYFMPYFYYPYDDYDYDDYYDYY